MGRSTLVSLELTKFPLTLSAGLRTTFDEVLPAPLPERLAALMHRLNTDEGEPDHGARSIKALYCTMAAAQVRVAPARARVGKARRPPFRPQLNEPNRQLSVTSTRSAGCLARCVAGACFGKEGDRKRTCRPRRGAATRLARGRNGGRLALPTLARAGATLTCAAQ